MNTIILHIEYLLRRHECVVLPGWGAFIARRTPAYFYDKENTLMMPPSRRVAFNAELQEDDGVLASSLCRREKFTYGEAASYIRRQVEYINDLLLSDGELHFGNLGVFVSRDGAPVRFYPAAEAVNYLNLGLDIITTEAVKHIPEAVPVESAPDVAHVPATAVLPSVSHVAPHTVAEAEIPAEKGSDAIDEELRESFWSRVRGNAVGIAATVAVLLTVGLFFYNPINLVNEPAKASIAPEASPRAEECEDVSASEQATEMLSEPDEAASAVSAEYDAAPLYDKDEQTGVALRFDNSDPYCVVVASFADENEASRYIASRSGCVLGMTAADGAYRVYQATAATCAGAYEQKELLGNSQAWVCMK